MLAAIVFAVLAAEALAGNRTIDVASGADLARALVDDALDEARVVVSFLTLADSDFAGLATPATRTRSLRVFASSGASPLLLCVRPFARAKVVLSSNVTLTFQGVTFFRCREGFATRVPGFDILAPSPPNASRALLETADAHVVFDYCFPTALTLGDMRRLPRPPDLPGNGSQVVEEAFPAAGCIRDETSSITDPVESFIASLHRTGILTRCWPGMMFSTDAALFGADAGVGGASYRNNYVWHISGGFAFCRFVVPESCILTLGLLGCANLASTNISAVKAQFGGLDYSPIQNTSLPLLLTGPVDAGGGAGSSDDSGRLVGILVGSIVGGCVLLLSAVLVAVLWLRWRKRRDSGAGECKSTDDGVTSIDSKSTQPQVKVVASADESLASSAPLPLPLSSPKGRAALQMQPDAPITPATPYRDDVLTELQLREGELELLPETLGKGAHGRVVLGRYKGVLVAVKQIETGLVLPEGADASSLARQLETFQTEVEVLARVSHPNVLTLLAASLELRRPMLVTELMETSLEHVLHGGGELLPLPKVLHITLQIAHALAYLHPTIIHRDLKPANILLSNSSSDVPLVKIADFGLSRLLSTQLVTHNPEVGTTPYMAPETFDLNNKIITDRVDVYAVGILMWEMLSGQRPWANARTIVEVAIQVTVHRRRPPVGRLPEGRCPAKLLMLIQACWHPEPHCRPAAAELAKRLALILEVMAHGEDVKRR